MKYLPNQSRLVLSIILWLMVPLLLFSQKTIVEKRAYTTLRLENQPPIIDGHLDDLIWAKANKSGDYIQYEPYEGISPSFATEFAIVYDEDNLYVGIWAYDPQPDSISKRMTRRDDVEGDMVGVDFDSYHDLRTAFGLWVSAGGVKMDRILTGDGDTEDETWDPNWFVKTQITELGWTAEMKIPFSQLRFEKESQDGWGLNLVRYIFRKDEVSLWQRIPKGAGGFVSNYGTMSGLNTIRPKTQFDLTPYAVDNAQTL